MQRVLNHHLVVSKTIPLEVISGVALLQRGAADVTDKGDSPEPWISTRVTGMSPTLLRDLSCQYQSCGSGARQVLWQHTCMQSCQHWASIHTKDARSREDLVSLGVMLGRPLLGWLLHGEPHQHIYHSSTRMHTDLLCPQMQAAMHSN